MFGAAPTVGILPPKTPEKEREGRRPLFAYRAPWDQADYLSGLKDQGYKDAELLTEVVGLHMLLSEALESNGLSLRGFALAEGLARASSVDTSTAWRNDAILQLFLKGIAAYRAEHPDVPFSTESATPDSPPNKRRNR